MSPRQLKTGFFILEGVNAFATAYYFNYLFFYLQQKFGFSNLGNLSFSALNGFVYIFSAFYGGRFSQKHGYFLALYAGFLGMTIILLTGSFMASGPGQLVVMALWTAAMCFTWPTLEALVSEGEEARGLPRIVGIYNMVWALGAALAFFSGGMLVERMGWESIFWLPATLHLAQFGFALWLARQHHREPIIEQEPAAFLPPAANHKFQEREEYWGEEGAAPLAAAPARRVAKTFLRMAWVANPLAYTAINTALPLIPDVARRLELSPMLAGFVCSVWMFARLAAFVLLWRWTAWHYRFGWLLSSYLLLILSFAGLLLAPYLWAVVLAQLVFGWSIGLIYYSSLFYSMDASDTKGAHGGVHEAAIGLGIFAGPSLGALALAFFPRQPHASAWAVSSLLMLGLVLLTQLRRRNW